MWAVPKIQRIMVLKISRLVVSLSPICVCYWLKISETIILWIFEHNHLPTDSTILLNICHPHMLQIENFTTHNSLNFWHQHRDKRKCEIPCYRRPSWYTNSCDRKSSVWGVSCHLKLEFGFMSFGWPSLTLKRNFVWTFKSAKNSKNFHYFFFQFIAARPCRNTHSKSKNLDICPLHIHFHNSLNF